MSDSRPPALFLADALGLDFLNTVATPADAEVEWIADGEDLLAWLWQARLITREAAAALRSAALPGELDAVAAQARALRAWFRGFALGHKGAPLSAEALGELGVLNEILARDEAYRAIRAQPASSPATPSGLELIASRRWRSPPSLLIPIAEAMAQLVCSADFSDVKKCESPNCTILFLDTTQRRARRWCSMAACGNRAKQAAHRERIRQKAARAAENVD